MMAGPTYIGHLAGWLYLPGLAAEVLSRIAVRCTLEVPTCTGSSSVLVGHVPSTWPSASPIGSVRYWVPGPGTPAVLDGLSASSQPGTSCAPSRRKPRPIFPLRAPPTLPPELISPTHHERLAELAILLLAFCFCGSRGPAIESSSAARQYNTNAPAPFVSYMYVSPAACALPFVLVGTWRHVPCSNCA